MGTRQVRVSESLYARIEAERREGETMADTLDRMVGEYGLVDFAADAAAASDAWDTDGLEATFEADDRRSRSELDEELP